MHSYSIYKTQRYPFVNVNNKVKNLTKKLFLWKFTILYDKIIISLTRRICKNVLRDIG